MTRLGYNNILMKIIYEDFIVKKIINSLLVV